VARRARGTDSNPQSRFDRLRYDPTLGGDPPPSVVDDEPAPDPRTVLLRDPSRTIVARNDSPDVGFEASINPYRGCEHGCVYCLVPQTPVLHADMSWRPLGDVRHGDVLLGFDERAARGTIRRIRPAVVEAVWWSRRPILRMQTENAEVSTTAEHRWLQWGNFRWSRTEQLASGRRLRLLPMAAVEAEDDDYRVGYVAGLSLGDGTFRFEPGWRSDKLGYPQSYWRVALADREPLERLVEYLAGLGVAAAMRPFDGGRSSRKPMHKVEVRALAQLERIDKILHVERSSRGYRRGFVAGFFDAEGSSGRSLRFTQVDIGTLERVLRYASSLGFEFRIEPREGRASSMRLVGSIAERIRFFATVLPAIERKLLAVLGTTRSLLPERVEAIEPAGVHDVVDIQTSTGTFFAAGLATHNCYARPTHEYLGWSAGLDFETKILVKEDAPALLRKALSSPRWKPTPLALSGVTDAYQPAERKLGITRRCLEVLVEFRHPVLVITKSWTVTRDADLLAELARYGAASVALSITSLDADLQRILEPRAAPPGLRLAAVERLAAAGVPVGVMVAPIVPGLTDHEIPKILEAAAGAGAGFAGRVVLRLPHGVKELFSEWLERHFPERKEKVLNRLRSLHGGALYDSGFGHRQRGSGNYAEQIATLFEVSRRRAGLAARGPELSCAAFRRPGQQPGLFDPPPC
jgi:DNA repair photolyase